MRFATIEQKLYYIASFIYIILKDLEHFYKEKDKGVLLFRPMLYRLILTLFIFSLTPFIPFSLRNLYIEVVLRAFTSRPIGLLHFRFKLISINLLLFILLIKRLLISTLLSATRT